MKPKASIKQCSRIPLFCGRYSFFMVRPSRVNWLFFLFFSLQSLPAGAQSGTCYAVPFGAVKTYVTTNVSKPIDAAFKKDMTASLIIEKQPLLEIPKEIARIRRGYISGFISAYPNAEPAKSWFGVDLDRRAAYSVDRYIYTVDSAKLKAFVMPELSATTWIRKWTGNATVQMDVVKYLPGNVGATNFGDFVCSANALWASKPISTRSGFTDALSAYAYIVDVSADGKISYRKQVLSSDPVDDAVLGIRARMH